MRRPYYNYWTYAHGDAMPEEIDPTMVTYLGPDKFNAVFTAATPTSVYANVLQNLQETPKMKQNWFMSSKKIFLAIFIILFILFLLAFVFTLIAWGVLSNGFKNANSNVASTSSENVNLDDDRRSRNCETQDCLHLADSILKYLDPYANPCQSFYHYVCGRHSTESSIPDTNVKYGVHEILIKTINLELKNILEKPNVDIDSKSSTFSKQFYKKCMNLASIQNEGLNPLKQLIKEYGGWPLLDENDWSEKNYSWEINNAKLLSGLGVETLISITVDPNPYNNSQMLITIDQPGGADNHVFASFMKRKKRDLFHSSYLISMVDLAVALGADRSKSLNQLQDVVLFETLMMNLTTADEDRQNHFDDYNLMSIDDMKWEMPTIDWNSWISALLPTTINIKNDDKVFNVVGLDYLNLLEDLLGETSAKTLANYHTFNLVESYVDFLSPSYSKYKQKHSKAVYGVESNLERWEECVLTTANNLPWALSALYVKMKQETILKDDVEVLVSNLQRAMERKLRHSDWMDDSTIDKAMDKLAEMDHRIAYPGFIHNDSKIMEDYNEIDISDKSYFDTVVNLTGQQVKRSFMRFLYGDSFTNWPHDSPPISVNAFYRFQDNEIVLPIGLLRMPLISSEYPKYIQYSRIGVLAGHEMTHAYDVEGSQYDKHGNLQMWWTNETLKKFQTRIECLVQQYDNITEPVTGKQLHGRRMIGESLSDNSALSLAFDAYKIWLKDNSLKEERHLRGLTEYSTIQTFFLSYANMWCETVRPEAVHFLLDTEEHALSSYRVDIPLQNFEGFSKVFNCPLGSPMNPIKKCLVW